MGHQVWQRSRPRACLACAAPLTRGHVECVSVMCCVTAPTLQSLRVCVRAGVAVAVSEAARAERAGARRWRRKRRVSIRHCTVLRRCGARWRMQLNHRHSRVAPACMVIMGAFAVVGVGPGGRFQQRSAEAGGRQLCWCQLDSIHHEVTCVHHACRSCMSVVLTCSRGVRWPAAACLAWAVVGAWAVRARSGPRSRN